MKTVFITACAALLYQCCVAQVSNFGNMYVPTGGNLYMPANFTNNAPALYENNGSIYLAGDVTNNQPSLSPGTGTTYFMGAGTQTIAGSQPFYTHNFDVNKSSYLQLSAKLYVDGVLALNNGIINTSAGNLLTMEPTASVGGSPSASSFINGPMVWRTNAAIQYNFPVGKTTPTIQYQPISLLSDVPSGITEFTAAFVAADPTAETPYGDTRADVSMDGLYSNKYWTVARNGDAAARVILNYAGNPGTWTPNNPGPNSNVAIASWVPAVVPTAAVPGFWRFTKTSNNFNVSGPDYEALHNTSTGVLYSGTLSEFNAFTIGHGSNTLLPQGLLTFDAMLRNTNDAWLQWTVADEGKLASTEIQHGTDGTHFSPLSSMAANGGSQYGYMHRSLAVGNHYYRLLLKAKDGTISYSAIKRLKIDNAATFIKGLRQTVVGNEIRPIVFSASAQAATVMLYDALGRVIATRSVGLQKGQNDWGMNTGFLAAGVYFVSIFTADGVKGSLQFVKKN